MAKVIKVEYKYDRMGRLIEKCTTEIDTSRDWQTPEHSSTERELMDAYMDYLLTNSWN